LFVPRFQSRVARFAEDFILFVSSIETGRLRDFRRQTIIGHSRSDKGFEVSVQMARSGKHWRRFKPVVGFLFWLPCRAPQENLPQGEHAAWLSSTTGGHNQAVVSSKTRPDFWNELRAERTPVLIARLA
jgi:hypothetical protein